MNTESRFIVGQGFAEPSPVSCHIQFSALSFQPRVVGIVLVAGMVCQWIASVASIALFVLLGLVLWWGALLPEANLFEWVYNLASPAHRLTRAPAPRRFAQALAGAMALGIAALLYSHLMLLALLFELLLLAAVSAILFARFCFGSWLYHAIFVRR